VGYAKSQTGTTKCEADLPDLVIRLRVAAPLASMGTRLASTTITLSSESELNATRDRGASIFSRTPIVVRQIDYDRLGGTSHNHPGKATIRRLIDLHVRQPRRDMDEVPTARDGTELTTFAPADKAISLEYIGDRLLLAMMMDTGAGTGLDDENPTPKRGLNSHVYGNGGTPFRPRRLGRTPIEGGGLDDREGAISAHGDTVVQRQSAAGYKWSVTIRCSSNP